jgi:cellulose synthase/poly-beta-1,6-N-acetylglucosamine synthase-like glycosyltransferase
VIVPAHDEALVIERTVASLVKLDWPGERRRVIVIADNCQDATAQLARAAGATVLERHDPQRRGKGYALEFAFRASLDQGWADAVAVVDADSEVSPNLLEAFACRIERGERAVQAHYGILNPHASWRTQLLSIAMAAFHVVRSRARERLALSCGIRGNGWCLASELLRKVPYRAFSLAEDLEYGIELGLAGYRVAYADEARADGEMVTSERIARKQRQRWEGGRFELVATRTWPLLREAARRPSAVCLDLALDLLLLPLSYVALNVAAFAALAVAATGRLGADPAWLWVAAACCAGLLAHVLRAWQLSGLGLRGLLTLVRVPGFVLWKLALLARRRPQQWVRTEREKL